MKKRDPKRTISNLIIGIFSIIVFCMLTSFVFRIIISPPVDPNVNDHGVRGKIEEVIQVNVLNANGVNGMARKTKDFLRARGFDVVEIGNNKKNLDKSFVYDRIGDLESAYKVAYALGIPDSMVVSKPDSSLYLRCSVILGKNYKELNPFN